MKVIDLCIENFELSNGDINLGSEVWYGKEVIYAVEKTKEDLLITVKERLFSAFGLRPSEYEFNITYKNDN